MYPWHWVAYYAYNLARKPKVWRLKHAQNRIYKLISGALERITMPALQRLGVGGGCVMCRNAYGTLKGQVYLSSIQMILKNMRCEDHYALYDAFLKTYKNEFLLNEELAAEINGFKR